ncbi:L-fuculose phosphate aldolase [Methanothermococcus okinawensis]|uniref:L-fuculose phosphate aldolase n=1 Tax=Methanothermococcus okinawensis (strain DSM 14208 / JCM 11175 / IH1) TaxID=647113 RepID=F8AMH2_METOI|nr:L-fuculose phosphate aldolase [Methanothermococcus okinawensis]AEH06012.1 L-fuculose-phosphate aldolase [Methanothermococcus okinawensis IH1]
MDNLKAFIDICHKLYDRKYVVGSGGNVSIKKDNLIYATPTGSILGFLKEEDITIVDIDGNIIKGAPTSEIKMHLNIYKKRKDINAVVHTHSIYSTAFSILDKKIELLTPEAQIFIKKIGYVPYLKAGSVELAEEVSKRNEDVIILKNHGIVCLGKDLIEAYLKTEVMEEIAKLNYIIHSLQSPTH